MIGKNAKKVLIGCAAVIMVGYVYHIFKIVQDLRPPSFWDLDMAPTWLYSEDYLPISIRKVWDVIAYTMPHTLSKLPVLASLVDFSFAVLLLVFTYRVVRERTGRIGLAILYIITVLWALFVLKMEYAWIGSLWPTVLKNVSFMQTYVMRPWELHSVLPKAILIGVSVAGLVCLRQQKAGNVAVRGGVE